MKMIQKFSIIFNEIEIMKLFKISPHLRLFGLVTKRDNIRLACRPLNGLYH